MIVAQLVSPSVALPAELVCFSFHIAATFKYSKVLVYEHLICYIVFIYIRQTNKLNFSVAKIIKNKYVFMVKCKKMIFYNGEG